MPELVFFSAYGLDGWLLPKEDEGEGKVNSSNIQRLRLVNCNLSDEFFPIVPKLFANVQELHLRNNNFIVIPECAKEFRVLKKLDLSDCLHLQKIRGIPPNMKEFRAEECESLTSSTISKLLNQELHEAGNTYFILPGATIPEWFDHLSMRTSISFWFREKIPALLLCFVLSERADSFIIINGHKSRFDIHRIEMDHTILFDLRNTTHGSDLSDVFLENEWNHAEILYEDKMGNPIFIQSGIHLLEKESSMDDIRLINPCMKRKLDDGLTNPCRKKKIIKW
ncbi:hypothetical protein RJT34_26195 [Clitoria ternatea]|uniref:Disease resistance protein RPS4B/Roq1-like leucine-rich repeats domain-containing protein n=1 Tax=Clitoria ternatea TaxID=43366 RepID=A0AAN9FFA5_CLITE